MVEIVKTLPNPEKLQAWLENFVRGSLTPDVSNYAKGRLRVWLDKEPQLFSPFNVLPGFPIVDGIKERLKELIEWDYDFCLVTYSGDTTPIGIGPHMDAGYADFEARSLHISGECRFDYWQTRDTFGRGKISTGYTLNRKTGVVELAGAPAAPTNSLLLPLGAVTAFNCKSPHAASPGVKRWNLNFWRAKPK